MITRLREIKMAKNFEEIRLIIYGEMEIFYRKNQMKYYGKDIENISDLSEEDYMKMAREFIANYQAEKTEEEQVKEVWKKYVS